ncbi:choice-of-anchor tandem repeat GloVer-containing protein [Ideonella sp. DXS29W]|uniref:Choice-of-anchor tandem repeat GloVer-containing protein n=1 Tax=Ideonella lacteola TaxID=2984193 RepID=A0ABU9BN52_9BURK
MTLFASLFRRSSCSVWPVCALALAAALPASAETATNAAPAVYELLHSFDVWDGYNFRHTLVIGDDGRVRGGDGRAFRIDRSGDGFAVLNDFTKRRLGRWPQGQVLASDGKYYGVAAEGGDLGGGTVYRMTPGGKVTLLHAFDPNSTSAGNPHAPLLEAADGAFYGTTNGIVNGPCGSLFRLTRAGEFSVLHPFSHDPGNGCTPDAMKLTQARDGSIYGVTEYGGAFDRGTIYRWTRSGAWELLYSFGAHGQGSHPRSGLVQGADGAFYGITIFGGEHDTGMFYRFDPNTLTASFLTSFGAGGPAPVQPNGELLLARDGLFYGTTMYGGKNESGTVYRVTPAGEMTTIFSFPGRGTQQSVMPMAGLVEGRDGEFFGTTETGGEFNHGTLYRLKLK